MNPLQFLYDEVDILKDGKNGKISLVYDKVSKQFYILKERNFKTAEIYERLKKIKSPYLPEIYRTLEFDGKFFIVEEFIQGRTLLEILTYNNGLDEEKSARVLKQLCECLKVLHSQKIIHRDIKPSNIILTENENVKLIDFSISRIEKEALEADTDFFGTKGYAPPEQYGFKQTDARSDIFSLGVTIQKILGENYNGYLKKILSKCTELDPKNRYQNVDEILTDIDKKFFRHKLKKAAVKIAASGSTCLIIFVAQDFIEKAILSEPLVQVEKIEPQKEITPKEKPKLEKVQPRQTPKKVEWAEIKMPELETFPAPQIIPEVENSSEPQISEVDTLEDESPSDPRRNRICTLTLNGKTYQSGEGEISKNIWQTWKNDGENIYLPENFSVSLNLENKSSAPLDISVKADLKGLQSAEKIFPAKIDAGTSKSFEIPIGGLACNNGSFKVEIWLKENDGEPLFGFWNGENFNNNSTIIIYLTGYHEWKNNKKKFESVS